MANPDVGNLTLRDLAERAFGSLRRRAETQLGRDLLQSPAGRWAVGTVLLILLGGLAMAGLALFMMFAPIDLPEPIEGSRAASTQILGPDGALIEEWHGPINRTPVKLNEMSEHLQGAAVAAEDARFYSRGAVDLRAVMRAMKANLLNGAYVQGGSTISQQYAKNVYVGNAPSISRKIREARVAYRLERDLGKAKVLEGYLNTVYFGRGAYGVQAASKIYFGKPASEVTVQEAALLVSLIKSPDAYSPYNHPARSRARQQWVLGRMENLGLLSPQQHREALRSEPVLIPASEAHPRYGWYLDAVRTYLLRKYGSEKVYSGGLKVQTTLDPQAQEAAEATLANALPDAKDPYAALVSIDPATGYVKALVGGRDYSEEKYNIALQGRRQPGSAFKPFVLAAALESGIPVSAGYRAPRTICPKGWKPSCVSNFGRSGYGRMNLEQATIKSVNTVYAQLVMDVGPKKVVDLSRRVGIPGPEWLPPRSACKTTADDACRTQVQAVPAVALGTEEVTPLELASGYATLAAGGVYREPKLVARVEDAEGRVLEEGPSIGLQAIPPSVAEQVNDILAKVITQGTGTRADFGRPAAGKTGTAQDFSNAWFSGYTPQLATAVWVGHRGSNRSLLNVQGVRQVAGGTIPAEMWREYMKGVSDRTPPTLELAEAPEEGTFTRENELQIEGSAADVDGMVQGIEVSLDGGPFGSAGLTCRSCPASEARWTYRSPSVLDDGEHSIAIRSFDKAGHRSPEQIRTITVDTKAPELDSVAVTGGSTLVKIRFDELIACAGLSPSSFDVTAGRQRMRVLSAGCAGESAEVIELLLREPVRGGDRVSVTIRGRSGLPSDRAGNRAGSGTRSTEASNLAPLLTIEDADVRRPVTATGIEVRGTAIDPDGVVGAIQASVDGQSFTPAGVDCDGCGRAAVATWSFRPDSALSNGRHRITFRSLDNVEVVSGPSSRQFTVDSVPPAMGQVRAEGGSSSVEVEFSEPLVCEGDAAEHFRARVGGRRASVRSAVCDGAGARLTIHPAPDGGEEVDLDLRAASRGRNALADVAGNPPASSSASVAASNRVPEVRLETDVTEVLVNPTLDPEATVTIEGSARDPDGVIDRIEVSLDDAPFTSKGVRCRGCGRSQEVTFSIEVEQGAAGSRRSIAMRARDRAAAVSPPVGTGLTSDADAPVLQTISARAGISTVTAGFSEPIACGTVDTSDFAITGSGKRRLILATVCAGDAQKKVGLRLAGRISKGEIFTVELKGELTDAAGNVVNPVTLKGLKVR
jgi:penicillin-binding protein 1A